SLVSVRARGSSPATATTLANGFAQAIQNVLDGRIAAQAAAISQRLKAQLTTGQLSPASRTLVNNRPRDLAAVSAAADPTVSVETQATPPSSASSAGPFR